MVKRHFGLEKILWKKRPRNINFFQYTYKHRHPLTWTAIFAIAYILVPKVLNQPPIVSDNFPSQKSEETRTCDARLCDDFSDLDLWPSYNLFNVVSTHPLIIQAPLSNYLTGWIMHREDVLFSPPFSATFIFIPRGAQSNVVMEYGDIQIIIGDAGYSRVAVKYKGKYLFPSGYTTQHFRLEQPIKMGSEVVLKAGVVPVIESFGLEIVLKLTYKGDDGKIYNDTDLPIFSVELDSNPKNVKQALGFGLIGARSNIVIESEFKSLRVE